MPNNRLIVATLALAGLLAACNTTPEAKQRGSCQVLEMPGWVDKNTFKLTVTGTPAVGAEKKIKRRTQAEDAAISCAQAHVLEMFIAGKPKNATDRRKQEKVKGVVKGGVVEKKYFDANQNCQIVFRIEGSGLKKLAKK